MIDFTSKKVSRDFIESANFYYPVTLVDWARKHRDLGRSHAAKGKGFPIGNGAKICYAV